MTSGGQGAPYFMKYGRELVSKLAISLKKSWGGYGRTTQMPGPRPPHYYSHAFTLRCRPLTDSPFSSRDLP